MKKYNFINKLQTQIEQNLLLHIYIYIFFKSTYNEIGEV